MSIRRLKQRYAYRGTRGDIPLRVTYEHLPTLRAPCCGAMVECSSVAVGDDGPPCEGAWNVCSACGAVLRYQKIAGVLELRLTTRTERAEADEDVREGLRNVLGRLRGKA